MEVEVEDEDEDNEDEMQMRQTWSRDPEHQITSNHNDGTVENVWERERMQIEMEMEMEMEMDDETVEYQIVGKEKEKAFGRWDV